MREWKQREVATEEDDLILKFLFLIKYTLSLNIIREVLSEADKTFSNRSIIFIHSWMFCLPFILRILAQINV